MVSDPYADDVPQGAMVLPRGSIEFLSVELQSSEDGPAVSPDNDWLDWDGGADSTTVFTIRDPDGNDITSSWVTTKLDPDDDTDDFDDTHDDYVGDPDDDGTDEHEGLFHDGSGNIAAKVEVPSDAEKTAGDQDRYYEIEWFLRKNGNIINGGVVEAFNVTSSGALSFSDSFGATVEASDINGLVHTQLTDPEIEDLIDKGIERVEGYLQRYGLDPDDFDSTYRTLIRAVEEWTVLLVFDYDASAYRKASNISEGSVSIGFAGNSNINRRDMKADIVSQEDKDPGFLYEFVKNHSDHFRPTMRSTRKRSRRNSESDRRKHGRRGRGNRSR